MSTRDILLTIILTPLIVLAVLGGMLYLLVYLPSADGSQPSLPDVECNDQDFRPLCFVRHYLDSSRQNKDMIDL